MRNLPALQNTPSSGEQSHCCDYIPKQPPRCLCRVGLGGILNSSDPGVQEARLAARVTGAFRARDLTIPLHRSRSRDALQSKKEHNPLQHPRALGFSTLQHKLQATLSFLGFHRRDVEDPHSIAVAQKSEDGQQHVSTNPKAGPKVRC